MGTLMRLDGAEAWRSLRTTTPPFREMVGKAGDTTRPRPTRRRLFSPPARRSGRSSFGDAVVVFLLCEAVLLLHSFAGAVMLQSQRPD